MMNRQPENWTENWTSYLVSGVIAITASVILSGCRFGNYADTTYQGLDTVEFFTSAPQSLQFQVMTTAENRTVTAPPSFMPPIIATIMTEPVALYHFAKSGKEYITEKTAQVGARVTIDPDNSTFTWNETASNQLVDDNTCLYQISEQRDGSFTRYASAQDNEEGYSITGALQVTHHKSYTWTGSGCAAVMEQFYDCYLDASGCWGDTAEENQGYHQSLHGIFDPFIDASAMSVEEIKTAQSLSYTAAFQ